MTINYPASRKNLRILLFKALGALTPLDCTPANVFKQVAETDAVMVPLTVEALAVVVSVIYRSCP
jgi:hypothetical protein